MPEIMNVQDAVDELNARGERAAEEAGRAHATLCRWLGLLADGTALCVRCSVIPENLPWHLGSEYRDCVSCGTATCGEKGPAPAYAPKGQA